MFGVIMRFRKIKLVLIIMVMLSVIFSNTTIGCQSDKYGELETSFFSKIDDKMSEMDTVLSSLSSSFSIIEKFSERFPLLEKVINMVLEIVYNFFLKYNFSSL